MILEEIEKSKFAQINNKRYYFSNLIFALPFSHPYLHETVQFNRDKKQIIELFLQEEKHKLFRWKNLKWKKNMVILLYRSILQPTFFHFNSLKRSLENNQIINFLQTTRSYILNGF